MHNNQVVSLVLSGVILGCGSIIFSALLINRYHDYSYSYYYDDEYFWLVYSLLQLLLGGIGVLIVSVNIQWIQKILKFSLYVFTAALGFGVLKYAYLGHSQGVFWDTFFYTTDLATRLNFIVMGLFIIQNHYHHGNKY